MFKAIAVLLTVTGVHFQGYCSPQGVNVAFEQNTTQSSILREWGGYNSSFSEAKNAVDGNRDGDWKHGSCTHTGEDDTSPSWILTFRQPVTVYRYEIYNRDAHKDRLKGFELKSFDTNGTEIFSHKDNETSDRDHYTIMNEQNHIERVQISVSGKDPTLTLCEVEIYGECGFGYYGKGCKDKCSKNCGGSGDCDTVTGHCSECNPGYKGHFCEEECPPGTFSLNCNETCSPGCSNSSLCNHINGTCHSGCVSGYTGSRCNEKCPPGTFGLNCNETCSPGCSNSSLCNHINGTCHSGCVSGFTGPQCNERILPESTTIAVPGIITAVVLLAILVCIAVLCRRSQRARNVIHKLHGRCQRSGRSEMSAVNIGLSKSSEVSADERNEELYFNTTPGMHKTSIALKDLDSIMLSSGRQFFEEQFKKISTNNEAAMTVGLSAENKHKNRYKNICAYDHSRVRLEINPAKKQGDYINASFIAGYNTGERFIATQGPTKNTLEDFLRMLWEQEVDKVVMLTNLVEDGKKKCEKYWPDDGEDEFGEFKVTLSTTQVFADYTIRRLQMKRAGEMKDHRFTLFHFTSWPDRDVPMTAWALVDFEQRVASFSSSQPTVVHCSAGVGRTGTFIALQNVMQEAKQTGYIDFYATLWKLRQDRISMIQTLEQYIFLYRAAQVALVCDATVTFSNIKARLCTLNERISTGDIKMMREFQEISTLCDKEDESYKEETTEDKLNSVYFHSCTVISKLKNRFDDVLPNVSYKPHLACEGKKMGNYINAVLVPSFTRPSHNILTQLPLPSTITDFWRLVTQYKVSLIISFELEYQDTDETIGLYLPISETQPLNTELFDINTGPIEDGLFCQEQKLTITKSKKTTKNTFSTRTEDFKVEHIRVLTTDLDPKTLLSLVAHIRSQYPSGEGRIIYMCRNGAKYSGLVCVLSLLLDRMDNDRCLTVPLVVGAMKSIRHQVIPNLEQYNLLYQALELYYEGSNVYGNF